MQRAFSYAGCAAVAASILLADARMHLLPEPALTPERFAMRLEPVSLDDEAPRGWRIGGAWELRGHDRAFSGLSGLEFDEDGMLVAVTDGGLLVRFGEIGAGDRPVAVRAAPIDPGGRERDAEAIAARGGALLVAYEGTPTLLRRVGRRTQRFALPGFVKGNTGAEALFDGGTRLYAIGEDGRRAAWFANGRSGTARLAGAEDAPTGAARWPGRRDGLLLQRGLGLTGFRAGVSTLRVAETDRLEAGPLEPLGLAWSDNAEGIAIRRRTDAPGYEVWIVTDDNAKPPQRTLLVRYDVAQDGWPFAQASGETP